MLGRKRLSKLTFQSQCITTHPSLNYKVHCEISNVVDVPYSGDALAILPESIFLKGGPNKKIFVVKTETASDAVEGISIFKDTNVTGEVHHIKRVQEIIYLEVK